MKSSELARKEDRSMWTYLMRKMSGLQQPETTEGPEAIGEDAIPEKWRGTSYRWEINFYLHVRLELFI